jgi:hypothetical protein
LGNQRAERKHAVRQVRDRTTGGRNNYQRFKVHYIPTSSSWLNLIERWFGELTTKRIRRVSRRLERETQTVCLDGDGRIHRGQTRALAPDPGADPTRLQGSKDRKPKAS